jgi:cell division transport system permease protein
MLAYLRRAVLDIRDNGLISSVTIVTIGLLAMMVGAFALFLDNAGQIVDSWKKGVRLMAYLSSGADEAAVSDLRERIGKIKDVREIEFVSKQDALEILRKQFGRRESLLDNLDENPLPDAFEISAGDADSGKVPDFKRIEEMAVEIEALAGIDQVEYGQQWFGRFSAVFDLFRFIGCSMGGLFVAAAVLVVANTVRLVIYTRREELRIMRLVGAYDGFIKIPFYLQAMIQGAAGALFGISVLYAGYSYALSSMEAGLSIIEFRFLSVKACSIIVVSSVFVGWFGCCVSLRQHLKI